ncbi:hypothetical protein JVU11DRAFT_11378 [Chiua virens]|nr:hypothetical protein JVU11DRAFT_11378 [Chiua virens]
MDLAAKGRQEWRLDGGPYRSLYLRNGRDLAIIGNTGHDSCRTAAARDVSGHYVRGLGRVYAPRLTPARFLQDQSYFAVAQKKYIYIYDRDGVELHRLKSHIEPTRLEFLPYHWLLASVGNPGYLKYQDTSTDTLVAEHRTKAGACRTMTQNRHNAVIHLGHQNGVVSLWTPNLPHPAVQLLAHLGSVVGLSVDPSCGGRYMASSGADGGGAEFEWSAKGALAVATGGSVNVHTKPSIQTPFAPKLVPPLYLTHSIPHRPLTSVRFCPFQDILTVGHNTGLSSLLVPDSGEPNFDSDEVDPFKDKRRRQKREIRGLLDKIQPDMFALNQDFVVSLALPTRLMTAVQDKHDIPGGDKKKSQEEHEKKKMRGKGKSSKRCVNVGLWPELSSRYDPGIRATICGVLGHRRFSAWEVFLKGNWSTATFVTDYFPIMFFPVLYISVRLVMHERTVPPEEMDFVTNVNEFDAMTHDNPPPKNKTEAFWMWLM